MYKFLFFILLIYSIVFMFKLGAGNGDSITVMAKRRKVNGLEDWLIDVVGDLNLGNLGLSDLDSRGSKMGSIGVTISTNSIRVATESIGVSSISKGKGGGRGNDLGDLSFGLVSRTPLSCLTFSQTGDGESKDILASCLLDSIGQMLHWNLNLLRYKLGHLGGISVG